MRLLFSARTYAALVPLVATVLAVVMRGAARCRGWESAASTNTLVVIDGGHVTTLKQTDPASGYGEAA